MTVVVTGAGGFLGRAVANRLATGHDVVALHRGPRPPGDVAFRWLEQDLSAPLGPGLPESVEAVLHLAQSSRYREFPAGAPDMAEVNIAATVRLAEYALRAGASSFVFASTGAVHGPGPDPVTEDERIAPAGFYPLSKLLGERALEPFADRFALCVVRPFFLYGAGQQPGRFFTGIADRIRRREPVRLAGPDGITVNPMHVEDAVAALEYATDRAAAGTVHLAGPEAASIRAIAQGIGRALGVEPIFEHADPAQDLIADTTRLAALLRAPKIGLSAGIDRTVSAGGLE